MNSCECIFFKAQFNYCPIIWMFHNRSLNNNINRLNERCLSIIYNDKHCNFEELLNKDNSVSINYNNVHPLAIELYKIANMSSKIMSAVFKLRDTPCYNVQDTSQFSYRLVFIKKMNQHRIWDQRFGSKYLQKLKIRNLLMSLKQKSKHGKLLNVHVELVGHLYLILVLFNKD